MRAKGTPVGHLPADNAGHGFVRRKNADDPFLSNPVFLRRTLGLDC